MSEKLPADYDFQEIPEDNPFTKAIRGDPQKRDASFTEMLSGSYSL